MIDPQLNQLEEILIGNQRKMHPKGKMEEHFINNSFESYFQSDHEERIIFCNNLFAEQLGYDHPEQVLHLTCDQIFYSDYQAILDRLRERGEVHKFSVVLRKNNGSYFHGICNATVNQNRGHLIFNWAVLDTSHYLEFQDRINQKNEELAKVNEQMEKFLYRASHDLRSPVASIAGLMNLIKMETNDESINRYVECINISVQKLEGAIRDIIGFSKARYQHKSSEQINWSAMLEQIIQENTHTLELRGIEVDLQIEDEVGFFSDKDRLRVVFEQLLRNSITYYDQRKHNPIVRIVIHTNTQKATVHVFDNGIGIESRHLHAIFGMFYRGSERAYGPGLGLYVVKESLTAMGGIVKVESVFGKGTTFRIEIPNNYHDDLQISMFA